MPRFLIAWLLGLGGAIIGLLVCTILFSGFSLHASGFIWTVLVFAVLSAVLPLLILRALRRWAEPIVALAGIISTFLSLLIANLLTSGLDISGAWTWVGATLVIWVLSMVIWLIPGPWRTHRREEELRGAAR